MSRALLVVGLLAIVLVAAGVAVSMLVHETEPSTFAGRDRYEASYRCAHAAARSDAPALEARLAALGLDSTVEARSDTELHVTIEDVNAELVVYLTRPGRLAIAAASPDGTQALGDPIVTATDIDDAKVVRNVEGLQVEVILDETGTERLANATRARVGERIAITFDGAVLVAPIVAEPLTTGHVFIAVDESGGAGETTARSEAFANAITHPLRCDWELVP